MVVLISQVMAKSLNSPTLMEENYDMEKCEENSPYITLLLHFNNLMYLGDWEYPYLGSLTTNLRIYPDVFEVEHSLS